MELLTTRRRIPLPRAGTMLLVALSICSGCRFGYERSLTAEATAGAAGTLGDAIAGRSANAAGAAVITRGGSSGGGTAASVAGGSSIPNTGVPGGNGGRPGSAGGGNGGRGGYAGSAVAVTGGRGGDASTSYAGAAGTGCRCPIGLGCSGSSCVSGKIVFVTSRTVTAVFGGISGADQLCADLARNAGLPGQYLVWLSDSSTSPAARFARSDLPYVLVNGTLVANNWADLVDGQLAAPINADEYGSPTFAAEVWTGTYADGTAAADTCNDWTSVDATVYAQQGVTDRADAGWSIIYLQFCNRALIRLMCFQQ